MAKSKSHVPPINWSGNNGELIWKLITELEKPENFKVFLGKKDKHEVSILLHHTIYIKCLYSIEYNWGFKSQGSKAHGRGHSSRVV